ncbi:MAG: sensor histidine kinase [Cytophagales bacterium]
MIINTTDMYNTSTDLDFFTASCQINPDWNAFIVNEDLELLYLHPSFFKIYKASVDSLIGTSISFFTPKELPVAKEFFQKEGFNNVSLEFYNAADEYVHLMLNGFSFEKNSGRYAVVFWNDITKYSIYEKKYLSKEIELNTLIYKISHDLRGPVASTKGLINLVKIENPDITIANYVDLLDVSISKLDQRIIELAKVADLAAADQYYFSQVDMHELLYKTLSDLAKNYDVYDMIFDFKLEESLVFKSYQFALVSILSHLLIYCIENKNHNRKLLLKLDIKLENSNLILSAVDNGMGIQMQDIEKIFSPFFRANESNNTSTLSLFTIKKSIDFLNGDIKVTGNIGEGIKIKMKIPVT